MYHEFQNAGDFDGYATYDYGTGRTISAGLLQEALWALEEGHPWNTSNPFIYALEEKFGSQTAAQFDNNGLYAVAVMNLYEAGHAGDSNYLVQDQLICIPDASIMFLLGPALISLGILGRRRKKA